MNKNRIKRALCRAGSFGCSLLLIFSLAGCGGDLSVPFWDRVMTIGEMDVSYDFLRYFVMNSMYNTDGVNPEDFKNDPEMQKQLEEDVYGMLRLLAAYVSLADDYGISISSQRKDELEDYIEGVIDELGEDAFEEEYLTEDVIYQLFLIEELKSGVYDYLINEYTSPIKSDDETIRRDIEAGNWFYAEYIGLTFNSDDQDNEREQFMQGICDRARAGESMSALAGECRKVYGLGEVDYDAYGFTYGQMRQCYEDTVLSLEIGEYSGVSEFPDGGYYIAHRLPLEEDYIDENFEKVFRAGYLNREIEKIADARAAELKVELRSSYEDFEFWTME